MTLTKSFTLALKNLLFDKMRSLLTMLGIIIGVAAVIILISLMNGMMGLMNDEFSKLGTDSINITVTDRGGRRTVDENDMYKFAEENPDYIKAVSPNVTIPAATVKTADDDLTTSVNGVDERYAEIRLNGLEQGRFLHYSDVERKQKVCVIGTYIEKELFGRGMGLGQTSGCLTRKRTPKAAPPTRRYISPTP